MPQFASSEVSFPMSTQSPGHAVSTNTGHLYADAMKSTPTPNLSATTTGIVERTSVANVPLQQQQQQQQFVSASQVTALVFLKIVLKLYAISLYIVMYVHYLIIVRMVFLN